jgi:hypothetical protein
MRVWDLRRLAALWCGEFHRVACTGPDRAGATKSQKWGEAEDFLYGTISVSFNFPLVPIKLKVAGSMLRFLEPLVCVEPLVSATKRIFRVGAGGEKKE